MNRRMFLAAAPISVLLTRQEGAPQSDDDGDDGFSGEIAEEIANSVHGGRGFNERSAVALATLVRVWNRHLISKGVTDQIDAALNSVKGPVTINGKKIADGWAKHGLKFLPPPEGTFSEQEVEHARAQIAGYGGAAGFHERVAQVLDNWSPRPVRGQSARPEPLYSLGMQWDCFCRAMLVEAAVLSLWCIAGFAPFCGPVIVLGASEALLQYGFGACAPMNCTG